MFHARFRRFFQLLVALVGSPWGSSRAIRRPAALATLGAGLVFAVGNRSESLAQDWKPAGDRLLTRWGKALDPAQVWPEYPRPQRVRPQWLNLNGLWQFDAATQDQPPPLGQALGRQILVPFPVESALSGIGEPAERVWYRRTFRVPAEWGSNRVLLNFGAVDWEAHIWLNGQELEPHRGGYDPFTREITEALAGHDEHELVVGVFDPTDAGSQPIGKQLEKPNGIWYTPSTGIWQTVWLEPVPATYLADVKIAPDLTSSQVVVAPRVDGAAEDHTLRVTVLEGDRTVGEAAGPAGSPLSVAIANAHPWSPDDPFLYDLRITLEESAQVVDEVTSYFGLRTLEVRPVDGVTRLVLNGKPVFQIGPLDQGFWPDGLYTAPSDEALRYDVEMTKRMGFNLSRKHVKVEPDRWYYWCDKLGLLVWQDMPHNMRASQTGEQFETELRRMIAALENHPSIVMWVVFNEGWGQYDTPRIVEVAREADPTRLVSNASGWTDKGVGDVIDIHVYPGPGSPKPEPTRAAVLGEFGGLGLAVEGHTWLDKKNWSYRGTASPEHLTASYAGLLKETYRLAAAGGLSAAVYTQLTDVEIEINGLLTYDREVVKVDPTRVAQANRGVFPTVAARVPTSEREPATWRYTLEEPPKDWFQAGFDASAWKQGPGGFGSQGTPGSVVRTPWSTDRIWMRRDFDWSGPLPENLLLRVHHDEQVKIYLNGVLAGAAGGFTTDYQLMPLSGEAKAALKPGKNWLAVECRQTTGGQYIDVGLVELNWPD